MFNRLVYNWTTPSQLERKPKLLWVLSIYNKTKKSCLYQAAVAHAAELLAGYEDQLSVIK